MHIEYPQTVEEAASIFQEILGRKASVIPAGRLTTLKAEPVLNKPEAVVLSARDLVSFEAEPKNLLALAGAGLTPDQVDEALKPTGLYWPVTGRGGRSLGGLLAEGALGVETMARGAMIDWVLSQTLVNPQGQAVKSGGRTLKNVSGYDYTRLGWRARGRLGLSAAFILKLLPRPAAAPVLEIETAHAAEAAGLAEKIILGRLWPEALRLVWAGQTARLLVWLAGFPEVVETKRAAISALAGDRRLIRHEDGFAYWREHSRQWPEAAPELGRYLGSRRAVLSLAADLETGRLKVARADLDIGGGEARLAFNQSTPLSATPLSATPLSAALLSAALPGLTPDRFISSGLVYERLKKGLDPQGLVFPDSPGAES